MVNKPATDLPRTLGSFVLLKRLAMGGMAEVYAASAKGVGGFEKLVAIKVIHPQYSSDSNFIRMLIDEAKIAAILSHSNIAQVFDLGVSRSTYFIVMEYVEGVDGWRLLRRSAAQSIPIPLEICAFIASEVCAALDYAHQKHDPEGRPLNIIHRDVSPQNVLLSHSGEVKLVDFGIAKAALRNRDTEVGVIKGKYQYMSPEQAWGEQLDSRTDIFSTGVLLYELLTGEMLHREENLPTLLESVRKAETPPPTVKRPDTPPELVEIVMKAMSPSRQGRYQTAGEMNQALLRFLNRTDPGFTPRRLADFIKRTCGPGEPVVIPKDLPASTAKAVASISTVDLVVKPSRASAIPDTRATVEVPAPSEPESNFTDFKQLAPMTRAEFEETGLRSSIIWPDEEATKRLTHEGLSDAIAALSASLQNPAPEPSRSSPTVEMGPSSAEMVPAPSPISSSPEIELGSSEIMMEGAERRPKPPPITAPARNAPRDNTPASVLLVAPEANAERASQKENLRGSAPPASHAPAAGTPQSSSWNILRWVGPLVLAGAIVFASWRHFEARNRIRATLEVSSVPPGAQVWFDGRKLGATTPLTIPASALGRSKHTLMLERAGYHSWSANVDVITGEVQWIVALTPLATPLHEEAVELKPSPRPPVQVSNITEPSQQPPQKVQPNSPRTRRAAKLQKR